MLKKEPERVRAWLFLSCCASKRLLEYKDPTPLSMLGQLSSMHTTHVLGFDTKALRQYVHAVVPFPLKQKLSVSRAPPSIFKGPAVATGSCCDCS